MKVLNLTTFGLLFASSSCDALRFPMSTRPPVVQLQPRVSTSSTRLHLDVSHFIAPASFQVQATGQSNGNSNSNSPLSFLSSLAQSISNSPFWSKYSISLDFKPVKTKALSSMLGFAFGEIVYQIIFNKAQFSLLRLFLISSFGVFFHGPLGHIFYSNLNKAIPDSSFEGVGKKVLIDQLFYVPFLYSVLVAHLGVLLGMSPKNIMSLAKKVLPQLVFSSWALWPVSHLINFTFVSPRFRLMFINLVQLISNIVGCFILAKVL